MRGKGTGPGPLDSLGDHEDGVRVKTKPPGCKTHTPGPSGPNVSAGQGLGAHQGTNFAKATCTNFNVPTSHQHGSDHACTQTGS